ncbi:unnamed protein product [Pleuronectes platessa]|uniref:Uncharacterized protein n=1 Tax=Pleuronectes platessa TaxID=8262 RepID=A0A9N7UN53_PLEPL|nr:unnamed protein product [Pleuronectes platessa]
MNHPVGVGSEPGIVPQQHRTISDGRGEVPEVRRSGGQKVRRSEGQEVRRSGGQGKVRECSGNSHMSLISFHLQQDMHTHLVLGGRSGLFTGEDTLTRRRDYISHVSQVGSPGGAGEQDSLVQSPSWFDSALLLKREMMMEMD